MGTRLCVTQEAELRETFKKKMVKDDERAANLVFRTVHNTARVAKTAVNDAIVRMEKMGAKFRDVAHRADAGARRWPAGTWRTAYGGPAWPRG